MKRTLDDVEEQTACYCTRSKRPRIDESYETFYKRLDKLKEQPWISATKTFNYMAKIGRAHV